MSIIKIAIVGVGKIARTEHIPSIKKNPSYQLVACASPNSKLTKVPTFKSDELMLESIWDIDAVAMCQPSQFRTKSVLRAIDAGKHILLEKPPTSTLTQAQEIIRAATRHTGSVFMTWHSKHAASVPLIKKLLNDRPIDRVDITWRENVRKWHPNQEWIWEAGGFGVFDPGINALSIMTEILPIPVHLSKSKIFIPQNRKAPIAAHLTFTGPQDQIINADFDWREEGDEQWEINIYSGEDHFLLADGGAILFQNGDDISTITAQSEYDGIYEEFFKLIERGKSDLDIMPLQHVSDAFMKADIIQVAPFNY